MINTAKKDWRVEGEEEMGNRRKIFSQCSSVEEQEAEDEGQGLKKARILFTA